MSRLKEFIVFAIALILALTILSGVSQNDLANESSEVNESTSITEENPNSSFSQKFSYYLNLIRNKRIDKAKIRLELNSLQQEFEKNYLQGLLEKRGGKYDDAFQKLFSQLKNFPDYPEYYEELAALAKISNSLIKISDWLISNNDKSSNDYYNYLKALTEMQSGNASQAAQTFDEMINNGFNSKEIYFQLANSYRVIGDYDKSFANLIKAENLCHEDDSFLARIYNLKGTILFLSGEYEKAKVEYESALTKAKETGNTIEEIKSIANLAIIKDQYGEIFEGRKGFQSAIEMAKIIENAELLAFLYSELGVSFTYTSSLVEARENYEKSFSIYEQLKNSERLSYLSSNIGSLYLQISNYSSAFDYYNKGLASAGENKLGKILNLTGLGDVFSNESNYAKALEYYSLAKAIADSIKDISSIIKIEQGIGALYFNVSRPYEALEILKRTDKLSPDDTAPYEKIKLCSKIGTVLTSLDSLTQSEYYFTKALTLADQVGDLYSSILIKTELTHTMILSENYDGALKLLNEVRGLSKMYELTQLIGAQELYRGKIYQARKEYESSIRSFEQAFELSGSVHDYSNQIEAAYLLGKNYNQKSDYTNSEKWYRIAIEVIEKISSPLNPNQEIQIAHFSGLNSVYNSLAEIYLKQSRGEEAFLVIDKARSRNTKSNLDRLKLLTHLKNESEYKQLIDLQWMTKSGLYDQDVIDSLNNSLTDLKKDLSSRSKQIEKLLNPKHTRTISEIQENLKQNYYIISVYIGDKYLTLFQIGSDKFNFKTIDIGRDSLLAILEDISSIYGSNMESQEIYVNEDLFSFNAFSSFRFYNSIFKDFLSEIPRESDLIFSLPPELVKLPIEMLVTEWKEGESPYHYGDKDFLLNDYKISYTPSSIIFTMQNYQNENAGSKNLLIGDPYIMDSKYSLSVRSGLVEFNPSQSRTISLFPLRYSKDEIESINEAIGDNLIFLSREATESNFKENVGQSNIIHISTHSFLVKDQPLILFTNENNEKDDGFLEVGEIVQLNLNSELVVLSSCRSGLGRVDAAEGVLGMQKAFFEAGSKSVLVSLWDVSDKYTSYFMKDFYEQLAEGKSKSDALRQAKLNFIKNHSANPYYWSAFVLSGNPDSIQIEKASLFNISNLFIAFLIISVLYFSIKLIWDKKSIKI